MRSRDNSQVSLVCIARCFESDDTATTPTPRLSNSSFKIKLERSFDPAAGQVDLFPQEITRVFLNLISNGFYAAMKRKGEMRDGYEPTLASATRALGHRIEI